MENTVLDVNQPTDIHNGDDNILGYSLNDKCMFCKTSFNTIKKIICSCSNNTSIYHSDCMKNHFKLSKKCPLCKNNIINNLNNSFKYINDIKNISSYNYFNLIVQTIFLFVTYYLISFFKYNINNSYIILNTICLSLLMELIVLYYKHKLLLYNYVLYLSKQNDSYIITSINSKKDIIGSTDICIITFILFIYVIIIILYSVTKIDQNTFIYSSLIINIFQKF